MQTERRYSNELLIGLLGVSESPEHSARVLGAIETYLRTSFVSPIRVSTRPVINEIYSVEETLRELCDRVGCDLVLTTGAIGLGKADIVPQATRLVGTYELPGLAEQLRRIESKKDPSALLLRQTAYTRETPEHTCLIVNLTDDSRTVEDVLHGSDGEPGILACLKAFLEQVDGPRIELRDDDTLTAPPIATPLSVPAVATASSLSSQTKPVEHQPIYVATPAMHRDPPPPSKFKPFVRPETPLPFTEANASGRAEANSTNDTSGTTSTVLSSEHHYPHPKMSTEAIARRSVQHGIPLFSEQRRKPAVPPLELLVQEPDAGVEPLCTVIWLHGMGASAEDFVPFAKELAEFGGPAARFIFPKAPVLSISAHKGQSMPAWFDILSNTGEQPEDLAGLKSMHLRISQIINQVVNQGVRAEKIFLGGFSQGAAMALYSGLRQVRTLAGILALSGYLPAPEILEKDITPAGKMTPFFVAHGAFDDVISPVVARKAATLIESKIDTLVWREYNMEHEVCPDEMKNIVQFMNTALQN